MATKKVKYRTKSGKVAMRTVMVAAQGKPTMRMKLNQGGPAKSATRKGALIGAVVGAVGGAMGGAAVMGAGGAAYGAHVVHKALTGHGSMRGNVGSGLHNPLDILKQQMRDRPGAVASLYGGAARAGAVPGAAAGAKYGAVIGAVGGAVTGYVAGRVVDRVRNRPSRILHNAK